MKGDRYLEERRAEIVELATVQLDDEQLIAGMRRGESRAVEAFPRRYGERINRWVWRLLGGDAEHDDVVHQVFVNVLASLGSLRDTGALGAWVDSVTIRTVRKEIRRRRYRRAVIFAPERIENELDPASPARQAHIRRFYRILDRLRPEDRILFVLRFLEGCSLQEIADAGGYSLATAKRRLTHAREEFRKRAVKDLVLVSLLEP